MARVGAGLDPDLATAVARVVPATADRVDPDSALEATYRDLHRRYRALYPALKTAGVVSR